MLKKLLFGVGIIAGCSMLQAADLPAVDCVGWGSKKSLELPQITLKNNETALLKFRAYGKSAIESGCNYSARVTLNGSDITPQMQGARVMDYLRKNAAPLKLNRLAKNALLLMYAPDVVRAEKMTADGKGASFEFDVTAFVKGKPVNTLEILNCRGKQGDKMSVTFQDIELVKVAAAKPDNALMKMPMEVLAELDDVVLPEVQTQKEIDFPAMPEKAGMVPVLRCQLYSYGANGGGCNFNAQIKVNGKFLTRYTENDSERLIGRNPVFGLIMGEKTREFPIFAGNNIMTMFAPNGDVADKAAADKMGGTFIFDLSDRVRGVDGNSIVFRNVRAKYPGRMDLIVQHIQIGYMQKKNLPQTVNSIPKRGKIAASAKLGSMVLQQGKKGGFVLKNSAGQALMAETLMSVTCEGNALFQAEDGTAPVAGAKVDFRKNSSGYTITAKLANGLVMERTLSVSGNAMTWREVWSNKSNKNLGVPFRHRFALLDSDCKFFVGGDGDNGAKISAPQNPTLFIQDKKTLNGFGISAENDWTRLLIGLRVANGMAEMYSNQLALPPGKSIELAFAIDSETSGKGYWGFINRLRRRWLGDNTLTAPAPYFWICKFRNAPGKDDAEKIRNAYAHLGPAVVAASRWSRLGADVTTVISKKYPVKADGSVDVGKFASFEHRKTFYDEYAEHLKLLAENAPEVKYIVMTHPAMEVVYVPEADKWSYAADAIKTADGKCFNEPYYSRAHLGKKPVSEGWAIYYYAPTEGSKYAQTISDDVKYQLDKLGGHGVYFDEFCFGFATRGYSRYDYSKSDGYSADLDRQGNVIRFKTDNAVTTAAFRKELTGWAAANGKYFYANGSPALMSEQRMPVLFFVEGGNGHGNLASGHLSQVPLALGNYGDFKTHKGIFEAAKTALSIGTVYSPHQNCNLLLKHRNEFVCRMYPLTIMELGSGIIKGKERIITTKSGTFDWQVADGDVDLYIYDGSGDWCGAVKSGKIKNSNITIQVPPNGMVIAERK